MIACFKKSLCRKSILALMLSIVLGTMTLTSAQGRSAASDLNTKVAQIDRAKANLDEVVRVFGEPKRYCWGNEETVVGEKLTFKHGVLYRDIDGRKGYCYYHRADQKLRLFFADDKITAIYVTRSDYRG